MLLLIFLFVIGIALFMVGITKHRKAIMMAGAAIAALSGGMLLFLLLHSSGEAWSNALAQ
jgi:hypothetical protein